MTNRSRSYEPVSLEEVEDSTSNSLEPQQQQKRPSNDGSKFSTVAIVLMTIVSTSVVVHTVDRTGHDLAEPVVYLSSKSSISY
jgi:hypothetical protein